MENFPNKTRFHHQPGSRFGPGGHKGWCLAMGISWEIMAFWQVEKGHSNGVYHVISQLMEHFMGYHGHIYIYINIYIYTHIYVYIYIYIYICIL